jgi:hypothetical protein
MEPSDAAPPQAGQLIYGKAKELRGLRSAYGSCVRHAKFDIFGSPTRIPVIGREFVGVLAALAKFIPERATFGAYNTGEACWIQLVEAAEGARQLYGPSRTAKADKARSTYITVQTAASGTLPLMQNMTNFVRGEILKSDRVPMVGPYPAALLELEGIDYQLIQMGNYSSHRVNHPGVGIVHVRTCSLFRLITIEEIGGLVRGHIRTHVAREPLMTSITDRDSDELEASHCSIPGLGDAFPYQEVILGRQSNLLLDILEAAELQLSVSRAFYVHQSIFRTWLELIPQIRDTLGGSDFESIEPPAPNLPRIHLPTLRNKMIYGSPLSGLDVRQLNAIASYRKGFHTALRPEDHAYNLCYFLGLMASACTIMYDQGPQGVFVGGENWRSVEHDGTVSPGINNLRLTYVDAKSIRKSQLKGVADMMGFSWTGRSIKYILQLDPAILLRPDHTTTPQTQQVGLEAVGWLQAARYCCPGKSLPQAFTRHKRGDHDTYPLVGGQPAVLVSVPAMISVLMAQGYILVSGSRHINGRLHVYRNRRFIFTLCVPSAGEPTARIEVDFATRTARPSSSLDVELVKQVGTNLTVLAFLLDENRDMVPTTDTWTILDQAYLAMVGLDSTPIVTDERIGYVMLDFLGEELAKLFDALRTLGFPGQRAIELAQDCQRQVRAKVNGVFDESDILAGDYGEAIDSFENVLGPLNDSRKASKVALALLARIQFVYVPTHHTVLCGGF